jgi:hypothetical protein
VVPYRDQRWIFNYCVNCEDGTPCHFDLSRTDTDLKVIVQFDFIPDITPYNALEKLPFLLVYS